MRKKPVSFSRACERPAERWLIGGVGDLLRHGIHGFCSITQFPSHWSTIMGEVVDRIRLMNSWSIVIWLYKRCYLKFYLSISSSRSICNPTAGRRLVLKIIQCELGIWHTSLNLFSGVWRLVEINFKLKI